MGDVAAGGDVPVEEDDVADPYVLDVLAADRRAQGDGPTGAGPFNGLGLVPFGVGGLLDGLLSALGGAGPGAGPGGVGGVGGAHSVTPLCVMSS